MAQQNKISAGKSTLNKLQNTAFYAVFPNMTSLSN